MSFVKGISAESSRHMDAMDGAWIDGGEEGRRSKRKRKRKALNNGWLKLTIQIN
jgi:hypothetical protein